MEEITALQLVNRSKELIELSFKEESGVIRNFSEWVDPSKTKRLCVVPRPEGMLVGNRELPDYINYAFGNVQHLIARITNQGCEIYAVSETKELNEKIPGEKFVSFLGDLTSGPKILVWFKEALELSNTTYKTKFAGMELRDFLNEVQGDVSNGKMRFQEICNLLLFGAEHRLDLFSQEDYHKCQDLVYPALKPAYNIQHIASVPEIDLQDDVQREQTNLKDCLIQVMNFASVNDLSNWANVFKDNISLLSEEPPENWYITLFKETNYSKPAMQLLTAAIESDVFGGMGTWNDVGASNMEEYHRVTENLFQAVHRAFRAAINSGFNSPVKMVTKSRE